LEKNIFLVNKKKYILYSDKKYLKLRLGNMNTEVQVKEKIKYRKGFLEKSCKDLQTNKIKKLILEKCG